MWINVHLFFKPEIKPDLLPNRFLAFFFYLITEERGGGKRLKEKQRKKAERLFVTGKLPEDTRQWKWKEQRKEKEKKKKKNPLEDWMEEGNSSDAPHSCCGLLKRRRRNFESWGRNQKCQQIESEQSWDRLEGASINTDWGARKILGPSLGWWQNYWTWCVCECACVCVWCVSGVCVCVRVAWGRMWDWLSLLSIMNG